MSGHNSIKKQEVQMNSYPNWHADLSDGGMDAYLLRRADSESLQAITCKSNPLSRAPTKLKCSPCRGNAITSLDLLGLIERGDGLEKEPACTLPPAYDHNKSAQWDEVEAAVIEQFTKVSKILFTLCFFRFHVSTRVTK